MLSPELHVPRAQVALLVPRDAPRVDDVAAQRVERVERDEAAHEGIGSPNEVHGLWGEQRKVGR